MREDLLNELGFPDPYIKMKQRENEDSLIHLPDRLNQIDQIHDPKHKWTELICGVLAGNVFDWGAKAVTDMLEKEKDRILPFSAAMNTLQKRPWLIDNLENFIERINEYKCCAIFVDNSGADIVLGMIPFARQLLLLGIKVCFS